MQGEAEVVGAVADEVEHVAPVAVDPDVERGVVDHGDGDAGGAEEVGEACGAVVHLDPHGAGAVQEGLGGAGMAQLAAVDHHHLVAHALHVVEQVGGHERRDAEAGEPADEGEHLLAADRVEAGGGLVEQHHLRVGDDGLGQLRALAHARREAADRPEPSLVQADEVEHLRGALAGGAGRQAGELAEGGDDVGGGLVGRKAVVLGHEADVGPHPDRIVGHGPPRDLDRARGGAQLAQRQAQQRRLAGAVGTDQPHGAAGDVDGQLIEREGAARVPEREPLRAQQIVDHVGTPA